MGDRRPRGRLGAAACPSALAQSLGDDRLRARRQARRGPRLLDRRADAFGDPVRRAAPHRPRRPSAGGTIAKRGQARQAQVADAHPRQGLLHPRRHRLRLLGDVGPLAAARASSGPPPTASTSPAPSAASRPTGSSSPPTRAASRRSASGPAAACRRPRSGRTPARSARPASALRRRPPRLRRGHRRPSAAAARCRTPSAAAGSSSAAPETRSTARSAIRPTEPFNGERMYRCRSAYKGRTTARATRRRCGSAAT